MAANFSRLLRGSAETSLSITSIGMQTATNTKRAFAICGCFAFILTSAGAAAQLVVLHSFGSYAGDAAGSDGSLVFDAKGNLYGTTEGGGTHKAGAVFELTKRPDTQWTERVIHSFPFDRDSDGTAPTGPLTVDRNGNLYGTTTTGGDYTCGTVFELSPEAGGAWEEKILHNFEEFPDGCKPLGGVILDAKGNLYGTAALGGSEGRGAVFELVSHAGGAWTEKLIWSFLVGDDGSAPLGGLVFDPTGNLFGTTSSGGNWLAGTVFELLPQTDGTWRGAVLYSFDSANNDGNTPEDSVVLGQKGKIYGTTYSGGHACKGEMFRGCFINTA